MKKSIPSILAVIALAGTLSACVTDNMGNGQLGGSLLGAAGGGALCGMMTKGINPIAGGALCGVAGAGGAVLGGAAGAWFDRNDVANGSKTLQTTAPGQTQRWNNQAGNTVAFTPGNFVQPPANANPGTSCRAWSMQSSGPAGNQTQTGTSCAGPDGNYQF